MAERADEVPTDDTDALLALWRWWDVNEELANDMWQVCHAARRYFSGAPEGPKRHAIFGEILLIEQCIPRLRERKIFEEDCRAIERVREVCLTATAALCVYGDQRETTAVFCSAITGKPSDYSGAFSTALIENGLRGWKDWRDADKPFPWVKGMTAHHWRADQAGGSIRESDALYGGKVRSRRKTQEDHEAPVSREELPYDYVPPDHVSVKRRDPPKSLSLTEVQHAVEIADPNAPFLIAPPRSQRTGAAVMPVSMATREDIEVVARISEAVRRSVPKSPEGLEDYVRAKYALSGADRRVPDELIARVLGTDKKRVNALQSKLNYYRKEIRAQLDGVDTGPRKAPAFIPPSELMLNKLKAVRDNGGAAAEGGTGYTLTGLNGPPIASDQSSQ